MIEIKELTKRYGAFTAVDGVSFGVAKGEVLGFLGPNGAGKSTTMKMVTGYLTPSAGTARILGEEVTAAPRAVKAKIGYLPEGAPAYADMTPLGLLKFAAAARGIGSADAKAAIDRAVARTDLGGVLNQRIETLSKGFKRRVGLAQAILHDPPVLIMDEPTDGLDPNQKHAVRLLIASMARDKAIILSTHILEEVEAVCTRAIVIAKGKIVADGTPDALAARSRYHKAVSIVVTEEQAERARQALRLQTSVLGHEERPAGEGRIAMTALARPGRSLIESLAPYLKEKGIDTIEYREERGRLDEVFRDLTDKVPAQPQERAA